MGTSFDDSASSCSSLADDGSGGSDLLRRVVVPHHPETRVPRCSQVVLLVHLVFSAVTDWKREATKCRRKTRMSGLVGARGRHGNGTRMASSRFAGSEAG